MALGAEKAEEALEAGRNHLQQFPEIELEYMEWVDADSMQNRKEGNIPPEKAAICLAAKVEGIRLIDNIIWGE
jgi:pantothenate synthetase